MRDLWCKLEFRNFSDYAHRKVLQLEMQDWTSLVAGLVHGEAAAGHRP